MTRRAQVIAEAETWLGTPYHHMGRVRGSGTDCLMLLAEIYAAADIFVFPSKTDTFGLVLLEALVSGLPVAAFPVTGPLDVIGSAPVGVLNEDLRLACLGALQISRATCVEFAAAHTWQASARVFVEHALNIRPEAPEGGMAEFVAEDPHFAA